MRTWMWVGLFVACDGGGETDSDDTDTPAAAPTFSGDIEPLFARNCASSGCHGGPTPTGLDLSDGVAYGAIVAVPSVQLPTMNLVTAGDPAESYLLLKLKDEQAAAGGAGDVMPPGFGLAQTDIDRVEAWIAAGAKAD